MEKKQHPSYGMIRFARSSIGGSGTALFGSSIMHNNVIRLSISKGMMEREGNEDWFLAGTDINDMIVEVEMSYTQFAEAITSLNIGEGIPVTITKVNIRKIPLSQLMDQIAYISQDNYLFDETVLENIRMGKPSATDEEVYQAARDCGCYDFILNLENGFQTVVGGAGGHLSGGERQRIAIARAVLKNAPIVILDEATAYIDAENEALIQEAMAKVIAGKTVLMIAHRLSTITDADKIVVVKDGQIVDEGTHEELLDSCMLYQEMWKAHTDTKDEA